MNYRYSFSLWIPPPPHPTPLTWRCLFLKTVPNIRWYVQRSLQSYVLSTAVWTRAIILSTLLIFPHFSGGEGWGMLLPLKNYCLWWGRVRVNSTQAGSIWAAHFPSVSLTFINDRFKTQLLTKAEFLAVAVFRQCPKVMLQKVLDFENQLVKTSHCALNDMI